MKWIRLGSGNVPGITFSDETHASGTIEAVRIPSGGVRGTRCMVNVTFDAEAGKLPGRIATVIADYDD